MDIIGNLERINVTLDGKAEITLSTDMSAVQEIEELRGKELSISLKRYYPSRSLTQNAYMWVLIGELSKKLKLPKEEVYRAYIKDYGVYEVVPLRDDAVERFTRIWRQNGLGWVCEPIRASKFTGYTNVIAYYGSSTYNRDDMNRLVDAIVEDCHEQGISTMTTDEIRALRNEND